jgi:hypothetical protein
MFETGAGFRRLNFLKKARSASFGDIATHSGGGANVADWIALPRGSSSYDPDEDGAVTSALIGANPNSF